MRVGVSESEVDRGFRKTHSHPHVVWEKKECIAQDHIFTR